MNDTAHYETALREKRMRLEAELEKLGKHDPQNPENWDVKAPDIDIMQADENEVADMAEEMNLDANVLDEFEKKYRLVVHAEKKFAMHTYGTCEVCGAVIESERLDANPAARTCKADMDKEDALPLS